MAGFTKLFSDIVRSTIWRESDHVRIVWITMLALSDKRGLVESSLPGLADMARVSIEQCEGALEVLRAPDPYSRSKEEEGRRVRDVDGGWEIINYTKYRNRLSTEDRRDYQRVKQTEYRAKKKRAVAGGGQPLPGEAAFAAAVKRGDEAGAEKVLVEHLPVGKPLVQVFAEEEAVKRAKAEGGAKTVENGSQEPDPELEDFR